MQTELLIVIPHYNNLEGLNQSLLSIKDEVVIDVLVIDDGSEVKPINIVDSKYINVHLLYNDVNRGITYTLNKGVNYASKEGYKYIARLDAGDTVLTNRFSLQFNFTLKHGLSLCGSYVHFINDTGSKLFDFTPPITHASLVRTLKRYNPFIHPSVMINVKHMLEVGGYPDNYPALEDWGLFLKLSKKYKVGNIPLFLLNYVVESNSISTLKRKEQARSKVKLLFDNFTFDFNSILGLVKNILIMYLPREFLTKVKKVVLK